MSSYSAQLRGEQQAVSRAYDRLDALRAQARSRLDTVRAAGSHGSPTQRTERDSFGPIEVPGDSLWGAQTQRSLEFFRISGERLPDAPWISQPRTGADALAATGTSGH